VLTPLAKGQAGSQYPHSPFPVWWTPSTTFVEHQGAKSMVGSKAQPSYTLLLNAHLKGKTHSLPFPGPDSTRHLPGASVGGIVFVFSIVDISVVVVVVVVVEVTGFAFLQLTLQSKPFPCFFLSLVHLTTTFPLNTNAFFGLEFLQYFFSLDFPEPIGVPEILRISPFLHFLSAMVCK